MNQIFLILLSWIFLAMPLCGGVALEKISMNDRLLMKQFFDRTMRFHQAFHVLCFKNKPVCLASTFIRSPIQNYSNIQWIKGWRAFKRNEHFFPHPNFIFNWEISPEDEGWQSFNLYLINKEALRNVLNQYSSIFKEVIPDFNCDQFIEELEKGKPFMSLIHNNEMLLGLLLGYGEESCRLYQQQRMSGKDIPEHTEDYCPISFKSPNIRKLFPIAFMGNPHSIEVQKIKAQYEEEMNIFWKMYKGKDPIEFFSGFLAR